MATYKKLIIKLSTILFYLDEIDSIHGRLTSAIWDGRIVGEDELRTSIDIMYARADKILKCENMDCLIGQINGD